MCSPSTPRTRLEFEDGFADDPERPTPDMPVTTIRVVARRAAPTAAPGWPSRPTFPSVDAMEQLIAMGMDEGMAEALGQIDELLQVDAST